MEHWQCTLVSRCAGKLVQTATEIFYRQRENQVLWPIRSLTRSVASVPACVSAVAGLSLAYVAGEGGGQLHGDADIGDKLCIS